MANLDAKLAREAHESSALGQWNGLLQGASSGNLMVTSGLNQCVAPQGAQSYSGDALFGQSA
jgi:hypothetical protein